MLRQTLLAIPFLLASTAAQAQLLSGKLEDPSLRRKVQLVYVETFDGKVEKPRTPAVVTQRSNVYLPHLLPIVAGTQVIFKSEDPELHNVYARGEKRVLLNDAVLPKMQTQPKVFAEPGVIHLTCNVHKEMSAFIVVLQNPFFTTPRKDGTFTISGLPAGTYTVRVWGEGLSEEQLETRFKLTVGGAS